MMESFLFSHHHWLKTFHVIAVISWMAAQLYLPRLFVYHATAKPGGELSETLKLMEQRLLRAIMTPAMIATLVFGILLIWANPGLAGQNWFLIKLAALFVLFLTHGICAASVRRFQNDENRRSARYYRILNEVPTLAMVVVIVAVIGLRDFGWAAA